MWARAHRRLILSSVIALAVIGLASPQAIAQHGGGHGGSHHGGGHSTGHHGGHVGGHHNGHHVSHHGGHHPHHFVHHGGLFVVGYSPSWWWYPSYGRSVRPPSYSTTSLTGRVQPSVTGYDAPPSPIPDGVVVSAPLVETLEAPEALPPLDKENESGTSDDQPLHPHVHEVPH